MCVCVSVSDSQTCVGRQGGVKKACSQDPSPVLWQKVQDEYSSVCLIQSLGLPVVQQA